MVKHLMEELSRLDLGAIFARNHTHGRLEHLTHPVGGHDFQILALTPRGGTVGVKVVEQTTGLVLLHVKAGEAQQLAVGVAASTTRGRTSTRLPSSAVFISSSSTSKPSSLSLLTRCSIFHISSGLNLSVSVRALHSEW